MRSGLTPPRRLQRSGILDGMVARRPTDFALHAGSHVLVYLIHGVTGTPVEMHYLAKGLARHGWDVYATTLPGHCTSLRDLVRTDEQDWRRHVRAQLVFARRRYGVVFVAGLSAGALLALDAAAALPVDGVGVMSPTLVYDGWNTPWSHALLPLALRVVPPSWQHWLFHLDGPPFGIKDPVRQARVRAAYRPAAILREWLRDRMRRARPTERKGSRPPSSASLGYPLFPLKTLADVDRLIAAVRPRFGAVTAPTVILQAKEDDMTSPRNAALVFGEIGSKEKRLILLDDCYHVITVDKQRHLVVAGLVEFFGGLGGLGA